jgi:hypothetical protein
VTHAVVITGLGDRVLVLVLHLDTVLVVSSPAIVVVVAYPRRRWCCSVSVALRPLDPELLGPRLLDAAAMPPAPSTIAQLAAAATMVLRVLRIPFTPLVGG